MRADATEAETGPGARRQLLLIGGVFALVLALLVLGYFLFLRTPYVVLAEGLRPADASAIVAELDKTGRAYRVRDGGTTILVPEPEADATRVAIAGSEAAARGQIGFELFNKSDMGLTNFAQKINFQRALQGELVRTITMMDGVESARVHLALPERALFRGDRAEPKAAVTVTMKPGQVADPARVDGIQRLVAAAVPDLPEGKVVVLDSGGRVISQAAVAGTEQRPAEMEERAAVESYYRARARGAVERQLPGLRFALRALAMPGAAADTLGAAADWTPAGEGAARNFQVRMILISEAPLGADDQRVVRDAIVQATGLRLDGGDSLSFETGPVDPVVSQQAPAVRPVRAEPAVQPLPAPANFGLGWLWPWAIAAVPVAVLLVMALRRFGAARLETKDHEAFAARLRRQLNLAEDGSDAVA